MNCPRCTAIMRWEEIVEHGGAYPAWICLICGERIDPEILANREASLMRIRRIRRACPRGLEVVNADG